MVFLQLPSLRHMTLHRAQQPQISGLVSNYFSGLKNCRCISVVQAACQYVRHMVTIPSTSLLLNLELAALILRFRAAGSSQVGVQSVHCRLVALSGNPFALLPWTRWHFLEAGFPFFLGTNRGVFQSFMRIPLVLCNP